MGLGALRSAIIVTAITASACSSQSDAGGGEQRTYSCDETSWCPSVPLRYFEDIWDEAVTGPYGVNNAPAENAQVDGAVLVDVEAAAALGVQSSRQLYRSAVIDVDDFEPAYPLCNDAIGPFANVATGYESVTVEIGGDSSAEMCHYVVAPLTHTAFMWRTPDDRIATIRINTGSNGAPDDDPNDPNFFMPGPVYPLQAVQDAVRQWRFGR